MMSVPGRSGIGKQRLASVNDVKMQAVTNHGEHCAPPSRILELIEFRSLRRSA